MKSHQEQVLIASHISDVLLQTNGLKQQENVIQVVFDLILNSYQDFHLSKQNF